MKIKKRSKILAAAIALLGLSTAASVTGTVAWFTANSMVSVNSMTIQAEVEKGIVIANETHATASDWKESVQASHQNAEAASKLLPTSTSNLTNWYHGLSDEVNDGQHNVKYAEFSSWTNSDGIYSATAGDQITTAKPVYLLNKFYVQASANSTIEDQDIFMKNLTVSRTDNSDLLSPSARVGVMYKLPEGSNTFAAIFAPVTTTLTYNVVSDLTTNPVTKTAFTAIAGGTGINHRLIENVDIGAYTNAGTNAIEFSIFFYFEGEDVNHKSANIGALDKLTLSFDLENKLHA